MPDKPSADKQQKLPVYVYEWHAWAGYLFPSLCNYAQRIEGCMLQSNTNILRQIPVGSGYFLFHVDLTKTNLFYRNKKKLVQLLTGKGITTLNAEVTDISKKFIQHVCRQTELNVAAAPVEGDANELLIVKTNFNYGGRPERQLSPLAFRFLRLGNRNYCAEVMYPVLARQLVKIEDWQNKNVAIERFITNDDNCIYRVYKLLNRVVITEVIEEGLIKKMITATQRTNHYYQLGNNDPGPGGDMKFADLLKAVITLSRAMRLDFAAIDVVRTNDNKYYIIDVNITPNWNRTDQSEKLAFLAAALA